MKKTFLFAILAFGTLAFASCQKEPEATGIIEITTDAVTDVTTSSAVCGGEVISDGGMAVSAYGVCWSVKENPTTADDKTQDGEGLGKFKSDITGLQPGQTYYVRAYAVNAKGVTYGETKSFSTGAVLPAVTTRTMSDVTFETAVSGGTVTSNGGSEIIRAGVCWGKTENPDVEGSHTEDEISSDGTFVSSITGLEADETFYVRAYAENKIGIAYGQQITFSTSSEPCIEALAEPAITEYVVANYDLNGDSKIQLSEAELVTALDLPEKGLTNLAGIEQFTGLEILNVNGNALSSIDATPFAELKTLLACNMPSLTTVNVAGLEMLQEIRVNATSVAALDVKAATGLVTLDAWQSQIASIDVSNNPALQVVNFESAPISSVDISNHESLVYFNVNYCTNMASLNIQGCKSLSELYFAASSLNKVDGSSLPALKTVWGFNITVPGGEIKFDDCPSLEYLHAYNSNLVVCSARNCPVLREYRCFGNPGIKSADFTGSFTTNSGEINLDGAHIEEFKIDKNNTLWYLNLCQNRLESLDLRGGFTGLVEFYNNGSTLKLINVEGLQNLKFMHSCDNLTDGNLEVYADNCPALEEVIFQNARLSKFQVRNCPNLRIDRIWGNSDLRSVDVTGCGSLIEINSDGAMLTELKLDAQNNPNIQYLNIHNNRLTSLDLSGLNNLKFLHCGNARVMESIKYAGNLEEIYHFNNEKLATVDVSGLSALRVLWTYGDNADNMAGMTNLVISGNPSLAFIRAFFTHLTTVDIRGAADHIVEAWFDANSQLTTITMRSAQVIDDLHKDASCQIVAQ